MKLLYVIFIISLLASAVVILHKTSSGIKKQVNIINSNYEKDIAYVATGLGCLMTVDTKEEFDNRQVLMAKMNLPVYVRCN